jgi:hypothetical protein
MTDRPLSYPITGLFAPPHTLRFETDLEAGPATGDDLGDLDTDTDTDVDLDPNAATDTDTAADVDTSTEPAPVSIDWDDPQVSQQLEERAAYAAEQRIEQMLREAEGGQQDGEQGQQALPDPLEDPDGFAQGLLGQLGQMLDQRLGPVDQIVQRQQVDEAQSYVDSTIDQLPEVGAVSELLPAPAEGAEDTRSDDAADLIEMMSSGFLPAAEAQYGQGPRAVQAALRAGAAHVQKTLKAVHAAGRASREAELHTNANAETDVRGGSGAAEITDVAGDEMAWAERVGNRFERT